MRTGTSEELAYLAGILDGEGCIRIATTQSGGCSLQIRVGMSCVAPLMLFSDCFGGPLRKAEITRRGKQMWHWIPPTAVHEVLLQELLPYLRVKNVLAEVALDFVRLGITRGQRPSIEIKERRAKIVLIMERLTQPDLEAANG